MSAADMLAVAGVRVVELDELGMPCIYVHAHDLILLDASLTSDHAERCLDEALDIVAADVVSGLVR